MFSVSRIIFYDITQNLPEMRFLYPRYERLDIRRNLGGDGWEVPKER